MSAEVESIIRNAVAAGKEVTTHQAPIDFYGEPQLGYLVIDPQTGAGGYHIFGGQDGAKILLGIVGGILVFTGVGGVSGSLLVLFAVTALLLAVYSAILNSILILDKGPRCADIADMNLKISVVFAGLSFVFKGDSAFKLIMKFISVMYGCKLFSGIGDSAICQL